MLSSLFSSFQSWYLTFCLWSTCRNQKPFLLLCWAEAFKLEHELESESLEGLVKTQIPGNPPQGSWSEGLGLGLRICISDEFPGDADVAGLRTKFGYHWCRAICLFTALHPSSHVSPALGLEQFLSWNPGSALVFKGDPEWATLKIIIFRPCFLISESQPLYGWLVLRAFRGRGNEEW